MSKRSQLPHFLSEIPYLTITPTGYFGYRRRVPDEIRAEIGREVVRSLRTRDPSKVLANYARVHAAVEEMFAQARRKSGVSDDTVFEMALRSLRAKGLADQNGSVAHLDRDDRSEGQDIILNAAGFSNTEELSEELDAYPAGKAPAKLKAVSAALGVLAGNKRRPTVSYCHSRFLADRARGQDPESRAWKRYVQQRKLIVGEFIKLVGDKDITEITKQEARSFMLKLEEEGKQPSTVKKYTKFMGALIVWSLDDLELNGKNQFAGLKPAKPADHSEEGVSFEYDEVRSLLTKTGSMNDDLQDIVRLLACTGARLAEITGLEVRDVLDKGADGVILDLRFNDIRRLKNQKSRRTIPVVDQTSVDILRRRIKGRSPSVPVFPRYGRDGGPDAASAILSKWLTTIGLRDPKTKKPKTTHSLRHTFKDALRDASVTRDIANMIQGHTEGDAADGYGSLELLARKREGMEKAWRLLARAIPVAAAVMSPEAPITQGHSNP